MSVSESFDPDLKVAVEEIKEILKKHDCLASLVLVSKTHAEFYYHIESSWSVMTLEKISQVKSRIRFRSKKEDFPDKESQHRATELTVHGVTSFLQFGRMTHDTFQNIIGLLGNHMKIAYSVWDQK